MNHKWLVCLLLLVAMVGIVSADTLIVYSTTDSDGGVWAGGSGSFSAQRGSAGNGGGYGSIPDVWLGTTDTSDTFTDLYRSIFIFNTSTLPDDAIISSAKIGLWWRYSGTTLGDVGIGITKFNIDGTITNDDYNNFEDVRFASDILISDIVTIGKPNWSLNSLGISNISKTDNSGFMVRTAWDIDNSPPAWSASKSSYVGFYDAEYSSARSFTEIIYTQSVTPVASFTCTKNLIRIPNTLTCTDSSTNTPTSWSWNMGDGSSLITTQNVTYQYKKRGSWGITLNATNAGGSNVSAATNVRVVGYENYW